MDGRLTLRQAAADQKAGLTLGELRGIIAVANNLGFSDDCRIHGVSNRHRVLREIIIPERLPEGPPVEPIPLRRNE
jgi:hypothetical protein